MRVVVELEPGSGEAARVLAEWQALCGGAVSGGGIELDPAESLAALLNLKALCYDLGLTVNATFPDNP